MVCDQIDDSENEEWDEEEKAEIRVTSPSKRNLLKLTMEGTLSLKNKHSSSPYKPKSVVFDAGRNS